MSANPIHCMCILLLGACNASANEDRAYVGEAPPQPPTMTQVPHPRDSAQPSLAAVAHIVPVIPASRPLRPNIHASMVEPRPDIAVPQPAEMICGIASSPTPDTGCRSDFPRPFVCSEDANPIQCVRNTVFAGIGLKGVCCK